MVSTSTHIVTVLYKIARIEVDHDKAPGFASSLEDIVRHVPVMVSHGAGSAVREDDWGEGDVEDLAHGGGRHVGQVHDHAESVHLQHHVASKLKKIMVGLNKTVMIFPLHE